LFFQKFEVGGLAIMPKRTSSQIWLEVRGASTKLKDSFYYLATCGKVLWNYGNLRILFPHNVATYANLSIKRPFIAWAPSVFFLWHGCQNSTPYERKKNMAFVDFIRSYILTNIHHLDFVIVNSAFIWWELHGTFPILFGRPFEVVLCLLDQEVLAASRGNLQCPDVPFIKVPWRGTQPAISSLAPHWVPKNMAVIVVTQKHRPVHSNRSWRRDWWPTPAISWLWSPKEIFSWDEMVTKLSWIQRVQLLHQSTVEFFFPKLMKCKTKLSSR
jgi:hypothetical protein